MPKIKNEWSDYSSPPTTIQVVEQDKYRPLLYNHRGEVLVSPQPKVGFKPPRKVE